MSRSHVRSSVAAALAALALLVGWAPLSADQRLFESPGATAQVAGVRFPMAVDTFDVIRVRVTPVAGLGFGASYATPLQGRSDFTLYVFSNGDTVEEQFESALEDLSGYLESQGDSVTTFTLEERGPVEVEGTDGVTYAGHRAVGSYDREGARRRTWLYVFEKDGQLVKHRATTPEEEVDVIGPRVEAFVAGTLGQLDAEAAAVEPEGLVWEQEPGPMRLGDLHLPLVADGFAVLEVERNARNARAFRMTYRSDSRADPILTVHAEPQRDTALAPIFARAYAPLRAGAEQREIEFEEDPFLICTWHVPGGESVEGISGGVTLQTGNGPRYAQVIATDVEPWHVVLTLTHAPGARSERSYPPILAEVLARVASEGAAGRVDAEPEVTEAPEGLIGDGGSTSP